MRRTGIDRVARYFPPRQVGLFLLVGLVCYLVAIVVLYLLVETGNLEVNLANLIASVVAIYVAYILNRKYIFKRGRYSTHKEITAFYLFSFAGLMINVGMMYLLTTYVPVFYLISKTLVTGFVAMFNFIMRKNFVFVE